MKLGEATFLDKETFGVDRLVAGSRPALTSVRRSLRRPLLNYSDRRGRAGMTSFASRKLSSTTCLV